MRTTTISPPGGGRFVDLAALVCLGCGKRALPERPWQSSVGVRGQSGRGHSGWPSSAAAAVGVQPSQQRYGTERRSSGRHKPDAQVDRDSSLARPVDVLQVEQQGELIDNQRHTGAVGQSDEGMCRASSVPRTATAPTPASMPMPQR